MVDVGSAHHPRFRVMTWNLRGSATPDLAAVARLIADVDADVVALQEVRRSQAERLADLLGIEEWRWLHKHAPFGLRFGRRWAEGIAVLSRFPVRAQADADLSRTESRRSYRRRVLQEVVLATGAGAIRVANTHLSSDDDDARAAQTERAVLLLSVPTDGIELGRTVLAGDLNCVEDDAVIGAFARAGLRDAWTDAGHADGGATNPAGGPTQRLDHVLVGADFTVEAVRVVDDAGAEAHSDHLPFVVDLVVR